MNSQIQWDDTRIFLAVARNGTLSGAAVSLNLGIATISRRLERLEGALGVPLFSRHQSGYRLTDDGSALVERAEALENAGHAFGEAAQVQSRVAGCVRIATSENLASALIVPSLATLLARNAELSLEVVTGLQMVNLHRRDADLAVRMVKPDAGNVTVKRLGVLGFGLYGAPAYLATRSAGAEPSSFDDDDFIGWSEIHNHLPAAKWIDRVLHGRLCKVATSTLSAQISAASAGLGLAVLPHFLAKPAGLICLLPELGVDQPIWLVIHSNLAHSKRVRVVADHLIELFADKHLTLSGQA